MPDLARIQALIVRPAPETRKALLFFRFGEAGGARAFVRACLPHVPSADAVTPRPSPTLHLSFSWHGLACLARGHAGLDPADGERQLEPFFVEPMPSHPHELGFVGASAPARWWSHAWNSADIDIAVHGFFADDDQLSAQLAVWRERARSHGLTELAVEGFDGGTLRGHVPAEGILHFGFRDGITKPSVDWADNGSGTVNVRELLLGYTSDEFPSSPYGDGPWKDLVRDGSMACVAWIEQHVARFNRFLAEEAPRFSGIAPDGQEQQWLAAKMMGRWRDGSPTVRWPASPPDAADHDDGFDYSDDPDGIACPLNAHIRVVNLRKGAMTHANAVRFPKGPPRFERRGFSYGPPTAALEDDGVGRGIVGTFFCARINEQFLTVLRWMQQTDFSDRFGEAPYASNQQDAMFGARTKAECSATLVLAAGAQAASVQLRDFITFRGVTHLLMPSNPTLTLLATEP